MGMSPGPRPNKGAQSIYHELHRKGGNSIPKGRVDHVDPRPLPKGFSDSAGLHGDLAHCEQHGASNGATVCQPLRGRLLARRGSRRDRAGTGVSNGMANGNTEGFDRGSIIRFGMAFGRRLVRPIEQISRAVRKKQHAPATEKAGMEIPMNSQHGLPKGGKDQARSVRQ